jgi:transcriptional regulator with XRE-family HTH domain
MQVARTLSNARRAAGLSQRALAAQTGIAQPTIARIERGRDNPRVDTLERLLRACGRELDMVPRTGVGIDRSSIRVLLAQTPAERISALVDEAGTLDRLDTARRID